MQLTKTPELAKDARETAILVVGVYYNSGYEIYAHERLAKLGGSTRRQLDLIKSERKPDGDDRPSEACSVAYDVAKELLEGSGRKGRLSGEMWDRAMAAIGKKGVGLPLSLRERIKTPEI